MIDKFDGAYRFLSNFYPARVTVNGITYPTVEHAYQAAKTFDIEIHRGMAQLHSPNTAKKIGKLLEKGGWYTQAEWDAVKVDIMRSLLAQKFAANRGLATQLLATLPHTLVEGNWWEDTFWGVCDGVGSNMLGKLLTERRDLLVEELWLATEGAH